MLKEIWEAVLYMADMLDSFVLHLENASKSQLSRQPLKPILERAVQLVRAHPDADSVELSCEDIPGIEVFAGFHWLCSAVFNLLLNACQAVQLACQLKRIRVKCYQDRNHVFIRIKDSGPGVPDSVQKTLSHPVSTMDPRRRTGLGIAIAKGVVREHGGCLFLESSRPGSTIFIVELPRAECDQRDRKTPGNN